MPPSKRKTVRRKSEATAIDNANDALDSSPSARSAKKRKIATPRLARKEQTLTPDPAPIEDENAPEEEDEVASTADLMDSVVSYLGVSRDPVTVATEHANVEAGNQPVSAYAKIAGKDWTYYVHDQTINIGRPPDERQPLPFGASSPVQDLKQQFQIHVDLGPSKVVSRHHASIYYSGDGTEAEGWYVRVNGRNGVRLDNYLLKRGTKMQLHSGAILEVAGTQMMFVLPNERVVIDQYFVDRAKNLATGEDLGPQSDRDTEPEKNPRYEQSTEHIHGLQTLAPAPPNHRRAASPPLPDGRDQRTVFHSRTAMSPAYGRGMMLESTQEIDYSRDSAKDLKPPYSYAHMIAQAVFSSEEEKLTLSNIYSFIADRYAFYRHSNSGWQNSIRHNLSLNKAFQKVPRRTDEPGKGMKWMIAPEYRQEYLKKMHRRGGGSSNPSSPAASKDVNPNFRGPNGQNLGYDTSMVSSFSARGGPQPPHMSFPPYPQMNAPYPQPPNFPQYSSQPAPHLTSTPARSRANTGATLENGLDESPLPPYSDARGRQNGPFYALPSSAGAQQSPNPRNPTLSTTYPDTPFHPAAGTASLVTPAPLRQNPRLAPPSTLVRPSIFMPESSPAGPSLFWKGFMGGMTPGPPGSALPPDMSPVKGDVPEHLRRHGLDNHDVMSSSPPPIDAVASGSPSKPARGRMNQSASLKKEDSGRMSIGEERPLNGLGLNNGNGMPHFAPPQQVKSGVPTKMMQQENEDDDDDDDEGGIDLAKGFAPLASFSSQRSSGMR